MTHYQLDLRLAFVEGESWIGPWTMGALAPILLLLLAIVTWLSDTFSAMEKTQIAPQKIQENARGQKTLVGPNEG